MCDLTLLKEPQKRFLYFSLGMPQVLITACNQIAMDECDSSEDFIKQLDHIALLSQRRYV
jgi:hypothetical protein